MRAIELYKERLLAGGSTLRERRLNNAKDFILRNAPDSLAYKEIEIDGIHRNVIMISSSTNNEKTLVAMPGEDFRIGSIALIRGSHWLITSRDHDDDVTAKAKVELCNRELIWQNTKSGEIISRWCTASKPYYSNIDETLKIDISSREYKIQLPYDKETSELELDKRFILEHIAGEPKTYRITSIDAVTERYDRNGEITGFLVLNITQDLYNPETDNADLGICDYIPPEEYQNSDSPTKMKISFNGLPIITAGGSQKKFSVEYEDSITSADFVWDISTVSYPDAFILQQDGNVAYLSAADDASLDEVEVALSCTNRANGDHAVVMVKVRCL